MQIKQEDIIFAHVRAVNEYRKLFEQRWKAGLLEDDMESIENNIIKLKDGMRYDLVHDYILYTNSDRRTIPVDEKVAAEIYDKYFQEVKKNVTKEVISSDIQPKSRRSKNFKLFRWRKNRKCH